MTTKLIIFAILALVCAIAESKRHTLPCRSCTVKDGLLVCSLSCKKTKNVDETFTTKSDLLIHDPASCISCFKKSTGESVCAKQCKSKKRPEKLYVSDGCRKCVSDGNGKKPRCMGRPCKKSAITDNNNNDGCTKSVCTRKNNKFSCQCANNNNNSTKIATLADDSADEYTTMSTCQYCYFTYVHGQRDITCVDEPCAADIADIAEIADFAERKNNGTTEVPIQTAVSIRYENCTSCWKENTNGNLVIRCQKDYNNKECHIKNRSEAALSIVTPNNSATMHNLGNGCKKCTVSLGTAAKPTVKCVDTKKQCKPAKRIVKKIANQKHKNLRIRSAAKDTKCWSEEVNGIISIVCKKQ